MPFCFTYVPSLKFAFVVKPDTSSSLQHPAQSPTHLPKSKINELEWRHQEWCQFMKFITIFFVLVGSLLTTIKIIDVLQIKFTETICISKRLPILWIDSILSIYRPIFWPVVHDWIEIIWTILRITVPTFLKLKPYSWIIWNVVPVDCNVFVSICARLLVPITFKERKENIWYIIVYLVIKLFHFKTKIPDYLRSFYRSPIECINSWIGIPTLPKQPFVTLGIAPPSIRVCSPNVFPNRLIQPGPRLILIKSVSFFLGTNLKKYGD